MHGLNRIISQTAIGQNVSENTIIARDRCDVKKKHAYKGYGDRRRRNRRRRIKRRRKMKKKPQLCVMWRAYHVRVQYYV
jgi:hypothetical protein